MQVKFTCTCGKKLRASEALAGKKVRCVLCRKPITVPTPQEVRAKYCEKCHSRLAPETTRCYICHPEPAHQAPTGGAGDMVVRFYCKCGHRLKAREEYVGATTRCPRCRTKITIPSAKTVGAKYCKSCNAQLSPSAEACPDCRVEEEEASGRRPTRKPQREKDEEVRIESDDQQDALDDQFQEAEEAEAISQPETSETSPADWIRFKCRCGEPLKARPDQAGQTIHCTVCGLANEVPSPKTEKRTCPKCGTEISDTQEMCDRCAAEAERERLAREHPVRMIVRFQCECGKRLKASEDNAGRITQCPRCGLALIIPTAKETGAKYCGQCGRLLSPDAKGCPVCSPVQSRYLVWGAFALGAMVASICAVFFFTWPKPVQRPLAPATHVAPKQATHVPPKPPVPKPTAPAPKPPEPTPAPRAKAKKPVVPPPALPEHASVIVHRIPTNARIIVDGQDKVAVGPDAGAEVRLHLSPGPHKIRAEKEGFIPQEKSLDAQAGGTYEVQLVLKPKPKPKPKHQSPKTTKVATAKPAAAEGTITLRCNVDGSRISVGKKVFESVKKNKPVKLTLAPGKYTLTAWRAGYKTWSKQIAVTGGKTDDIAIKLQLIPDEIASEKDGRQMVLVREGWFLMGSDDGPPECRPSHRVFLKAYYIDVYEVTNAAFAKFVEQTRCRPAGNWRRYYKQGQDEYPVRGVTYDDAAKYAAWAGKRLPTEAEWEKAARGTDGRRYPWGDGFDDTAFRGKLPEDAGPAAVGSYPSGSSFVGCFDMAGNVWEWCSDWYQRNYYETTQEWVNPTGPRPRDRKGGKVVRGGAWDFGSVGYIKCYSRKGLPPNNSDPTVGFRCVMDVPE